MLFQTESARNDWKIANFLDFEAKGLTLQDRLILLHYAICRAKTRANPSYGMQELDYVEMDCLKALTELEQGKIDETDPFIRHRLARMARIASHYEGTIERVNRRYWWLFFLLGLAVVIYLMSQPIPANFL